MFHRHGLEQARRHRRIAIRNAARHDRGRRDRHRAQDPHGGMAVAGNESARADLTARHRLGPQTHFWHDLFGHLAQIHRGTGLQANRFDPLLERGVGIEFIAALVARRPQRFGGHHDHRHAIVDAGDIHIIEPIHEVSGGQQRAAHGTRRLQKTDFDGRGRPRYAVDAGVAGIFNPAARGAHLDIAQGSGVAGQDPQGGDVALGPHQSGLEPEGHDRRQHIAAVGRGIDESFLDGHLGKQKFQIDARGPAAADHPDLAGQGVGAAHAVDLARVGRAHHRQQDRVALRNVRGQVVLEKERASRSSAAHEKTGDGSLYHFCLLPVS